MRRPKTCVESVVYNLPGLDDWAAARCSPLISIPKEYVPMSTAMTSVQPGAYGFPVSIKKRYDNYIGGKWTAPVAASTSTT